MNYLKKKNRVLDILQSTFYNNISVNYVLKQDNKKDKRLRTLLEYSYFMGTEFGEVILTDDESTCAIIVDPLRKKTTLKSIYWNIRIGIHSIGLGNIKKVLKRESILNRHHPDCPYVYLWYIGVDESHQGKGKGTKLINQLISKYTSLDRPIYLQTSTERNFAFYERLGFEKIADPEVGFPMKLYLKK